MLPPVFVTDAGSYAPVTILIDERQDGVHLAYDRMASLLAQYGNSEALKVDRDLASKVEATFLSSKPIWWHPMSGVRLFWAQDIG